MVNLNSAFSYSARSTLDSDAVNNHLREHLAAVKSPEGFTNRAEFEQRYLMLARENLADAYLLEKIQNGKRFGTQEAIAYISALPVDYRLIKHKTGEMENIINPISKTGTGRMSPQTKNKLEELEGATVSLKRAADKDVSFQNDKNTQSFLMSANKKGLTAQDLVTFYELSQGEILPTRLSYPLLEAQRSLDESRDNKPEQKKAAFKEQAAPSRILDI